jgi:diadenylate cyclase
VGMSESTDTLVLAISEETGRLILARNGKYLRALKLKQVEQRVLAYLRNDEPINWEELKEKEEEEQESAETSEAKA